MTMGWETTKGFLKKDSSWYGRIE